MRKIIGECVDDFLILRPFTSILVTYYSTYPQVKLFLIHVFVFTFLFSRLFEINEFTAPALFMTCMSGLSLYLVTNFFEDRQRCKQPEKRTLSSRQRSNEEVADTPACFGYLNIRTLCLLGCMIMNAFTKGPMSCFEALGIEFAESRFGMHRAQAGSIVASMGLLGAIILLGMGALSRRFDDTQLTSGGILLFIIGIVLNTQLDQNENNAHWKYALSMFCCYSVGYPICHTALVGLFSKSECHSCCTYIFYTHLLF